MLWKLKNQDFGIRRLEWLQKQGKRLLCWSNKVKTKRFWLKPILEYNFFPIDKSIGNSKGRGKNLKLKYFEFVWVNYDGFLIERT